MPPEAIVGEELVDQRADIYALGCVGYWLLTGQLVFDAGTTVGMLTAHVISQPVPPTNESIYPSRPSSSASCSIVCIKTLLSAPPPRRLCAKPSLGFHCPSPGLASAPPPGGQSTCRRDAWYLRRRRRSSYRLLLAQRSRPASTGYAGHLLVINGGRTSAAVGSALGFYPRLLRSWPPGAVLHCSSRSAIAAGWRWRV